MAAERTSRHAPALSRCASHADVSASVRSSGRNLSPCPIALAHENDMKPAIDRSDAGIHSGSSVHGTTSWATSFASSIHAGSTARPAAREHPERVDERAHRDAVRRRHRVERPGDPRGREIEHPLRQIARVDELHRARRRRRHDRPRAALAQHFRMQEPRDPIGEAIGRIVRSDDEPRADDRRALVEGGDELALAGGLERAVVRGDILRGGVRRASRPARPRSVLRGCRRRRPTATTRRGRARRDRRAAAPRRRRSAAGSRWCRSRRPTTPARARPAPARWPDRDCRRAASPRGPRAPACGRA